MAVWTGVEGASSVPLFLLLLSETCYAEGKAKRVTSVGELPCLSSQSQLWLTLELRKGHFVKAIATEDEGQGGCPRERTMA